MWRQPDYRHGAYQDESNFLALERCRRLIADERVVIEGDDGIVASGRKVIALVNRAAGVSRVEFARWLRGEHLVGITALHRPARYVQGLCEPESGDRDPVFDAVCEFWFPRRVDPVGTARRVLGSDVQTTAAVVHEVEIGSFTEGVV